MSSFEFGDDGTGRGAHPHDNTGDTQTVGMQMHSHPGCTTTSKGCSMDTTDVAAVLHQQLVAAGWHLHSLEHTNDVQVATWQRTPQVLQTAVSAEHDSTTVELLAVDTRQPAVSAVAATRGLNLFHNPTGESEVGRQVRQLLHTTGLSSLWQPDDPAEAHRWAQQLLVHTAVDVLDVPRDQLAAAELNSQPPHAALPAWLRPLLPVELTDQAHVVPAPHVRQARQGLRQLLPGSQADSIIADNGTLDVHQLPHQQSAAAVRQAAEKLGERWTLTLLAALGSPSASAGPHSH